MSQELTFEVDVSVILHCLHAKWRDVCDAIVKAHTSTAADCVLLVIIQFAVIRTGGRYNSCRFEVESANV